MNVLEKHSILCGKTVTAGRGRVIGMEKIKTDCVINMKSPEVNPEGLLGFERNPNDF